MKNEMKSKQFVYLAMILLVFISLASPVLAHAGEDDYDHHGTMGGMMGGLGGMMGFGWIFMILIIVASIWFIVWLIKQIQEPKLRR